MFEENRVLVLTREDVSDNIYESISNNQTVADGLILSSKSEYGLSMMVEAKRVKKTTPAEVKTIIDKAVENNAEWVFVKKGVSL